MNLGGSRLEREFQPRELHKPLGLEEALRELPPHAKIALAAFLDELRSLNTPT